MIQAIQQNFLNPLGLTALLALIPLIIFYLVRPKPEKEIMPSMTFFTEEKQRSKIKNALNKLKRNKLLLLHILFIILASAAIANPLITGLESEGNSVIILDTSASMHNDKTETQKFALKHLGNTNTILTTGNTVELQGTSLSTTQARQIIREYENTGSSTNLVSALQQARNYNGKIVIASDMDHTEAGNLENLIQTTSTQRTIKIMDNNHRNSHAFTNMNINGQKVEATIQNFLNQNRTLTIQKPGENIQKTIPASSTATIQMNLQPGTHEIQLPPDELTIDNTLHVSIPQQQKITVKRIGQESRYFKKTIELISQTEYTSGTTLQDADIYYISKDYPLTQRKDQRLEELKNQGTPIIMEPRPDLPSFMPVENQTQTQKNTQIQIKAGEITATFNSNITSYDITGESLSQPHEAIVLSKDKKALLYNVNDENFGKKITYPIFWKNTLLEMTNQKTGSQLNLKTGQTTEFTQPVTKNQETLQGTNTIQQTGFYQGQNTYAANTLTPEESKPYIQQPYRQNNNIDQNPGKDPARKYLISLISLLALFELIYLSKQGAI